MTNCPQCGKPIPEGRDTCPACGEKTANLSPEIQAKILLLKKKIEQEPGSARLYMDLGDLYQKHGLMDEAVAEYEEAVNTDAQNHDAHMRVAHAYFKLKEFSNAESAFRAALHVNPKSVDSLIGLFRIYYLQDKTEEAVVIGEKIVQAKPDNVEFHLLLKNMYIRKGDQEKALQQLLRLETLTPQNEHIIRELAHRYMESNNMQKVVEYYDKLKGLKITDIDLGLKVCDHFLSVHDHPKAAECLNGLLVAEDLTPDQHLNVLVSLAGTHVASGNYADGQKILDALRPGPDEQLDAEVQKKIAAIYYQIGQAALQDQKPKQAVTSMEKATRLDKEKEEYIQTLSTVKVKTSAENRESIKKISLIALIALAACAVIALQWVFMRNKIVIQVTPGDSAAVFVDGKLLLAQAQGQDAVSSPVLFMGRHKVTVEKSGYEKWEGTATIGYARTSRLAVELMPICFVLQVASIPESADVLIDGRIVGKTPFAASDLLVRSHAIELTSDGYAAWRGTLTVNKKDTVNLGTISLKNLAGRWAGKVETEAYASNAGINLEIAQAGTQLRIKYAHQSIDDRLYKGEIKGRISNGEFFAAGEVTVTYTDLLRRTRRKVIVTLRGRVADSWDRIAGMHLIDGLGEHAYWISRQQ
jgi:tetratricopeptide (TPR) repeat protein